MSSTFSGLEIGKSGLASAQIALNITGHNISNADTKGYTRQTVKIATKEPVGAGYVIRQITEKSNVGQGVEVTSISQIRSSYLDTQYRDQYADFCESEYRTQGLSYLEDLFNELDDNTSLTISVSDFFDALSDFAGDTTSEAARTSVQQKALTLTSNFNMIYEEMVDLYNEQNSAVETVASQSNELASEIAELNQKVAEYERAGVTANDLRDKRNVLLDELSGYLDISCSEQSNGTITVQVAGETLVEGNAASAIQISSLATEVNSLCSEIASYNDQITTAIGAGAPVEEIDALEAAREDLCRGVLAISEGSVVTYETDGTATVAVTGVTAVSGSTAVPFAADAFLAFDGAEDQFVLKLGATYLTTETIDSGELAAHLKSRDNSTTEESGVPYYIGRLDELARSVVQSVNECMNTGYTYPNEENGYASVSGEDVDLFNDFGNDYDAVTAGNFSLSASVLESVWNIAGSSREIDLDADDTQSSNNEVAQQLEGLLGANHFGDDLASLISQLGITVESSESMLDTRKSLVESTQRQRESVSGVSIDEEAINLIKYEQTYNACSRVITTMDQLLDKLINGTGRVGL